MGQDKIRKPDAAGSYGKQRETRVDELKRKLSTPSKCGRANSGSAGGVEGGCRRINLTIRRAAIVTVRVADVRVVTVRVTDSIVTAICVENAFRLTGKMSVNIVVAEECL